MASSLLFHTSCGDSVMDLESQGVEMKTRAVDSRVQNLIELARNGDVEACKSLALCYRDGDGVEKSWFNTICMYAIYTQKTGGDIKRVEELFEKESHLMLLYKILDSSSENDFEAKLQQLKQFVPAEAKALEAAKKVFSMNDAAIGMSTIREAEAEGSELAAVLQVMYYEKTNDKTGLEECLIRVAEKYPFFNLLLGELYAENYHENNDFSYIQKAIDCFYKADAHGMLIPKYANKLCRMYACFGEKGLLECDKQEIERLKILCKIY